MRLRLSLLLLFLEAGSLALVCGWVSVGTPSINLNIRRGSWLRVAEHATVEGVPPLGEDRGECTEGFKGIMADTNGVGGSMLDSNHPIKVHAFIDGTWMYYSLFGREDRCPIAAKYGPRWHRQYRFAWERLPVLIGKAVADHIHRQQPSRFVEVYRTTVFSSVRPETAKGSLRMQMFRDMQEYNFEVHLATTSGVAEKCVDIALAVEMLNCATVPDPYDIAVLVTGDKDFVPAMRGVRQKGKRVALTTMRNSCNRHLYDPSNHTVDLPIIWIDEYLDQLLVPDDSYIRAGMDQAQSDIIAEVVAGLLEQQPGRAMTSRALGQALQGVALDNETVLSLIKKYFSGLRTFLTLYRDMFTCSMANENANLQADRKCYLVLLCEEEEPADAAVQEVAEEELEALKVVELKERLRELGLPMSGKKQELVSRLRNAIAEVGEDEDDEDVMDDEEGVSGDAPDWRVAPQKQQHLTYEEADSRRRSHTGAGSSSRLEKVVAEHKVTLLPGSAVTRPRPGRGRGADSRHPADSRHEHNREPHEHERHLIELISKFVEGNGGEVSPAVPALLLLLHKANYLICLQLELL
ncbi:unnamed protein product [Chrysoparadoxa australica]